MTMPEVSEGLEYRLIEDGVAYEVLSGDFNGAGVIVLPDYYEGKPVIRIAEEGFSRVSVGNELSRDITGVRLPQTLKSIENSAFYQTVLEKVVFPLGLEKIGSMAFSGTSLQEIVIPENVTSIGGSAFKSTQLQKIIIPENVTNIGGSAFEDCASLAEVRICATSPTLGARVFENTAWYKAQPDGYIYFGQTLYRYKGDFAKNAHLDLSDFATKKIADRAFSMCKGLTSVEIPFDVQWGNYTFFGCEDLKSVRLEEGLTEIPIGTFGQCSKLAELNFPSTLEKIGKIAFYESAIGGEIIFPMALTEIGEQAFGGCENLKSVSFQDKLASIGAFAFQGCDGLKGMIIPESVTDLGNMGFSESIEWVVFSFFAEDFSYQEIFKNLYSLEHIYIRDTQETIAATREENLDFNLFCKTETLTTDGKSITKIVYAYCEEPPTEEGDFWHYDTDGVTPIPWEN
ncbi:MAG: leucine-rich repeat domain-containing protein [Clostridia bacterium]|nr:leucine-rich repeat domain-containing protein [Clostridia bacterium]